MRSEIMGTERLVVILLAGAVWLVAAPTRADDELPVVDPVPVRAEVPGESSGESAGENGDESDLSLDLPLVPIEPIESMKPIVAAAPPEAVEDTGSPAQVVEAAGDAAGDAVPQTAQSRSAVTPPVDPPEIPAVVQPSSTPVAAPVAAAPAAAAVVEVPAAALASSAAPAGSAVSSGRPFYQHWWFYAGAGAVTAAVVTSVAVALVSQPEPQHRNTFGLSVAR